MTEKFPEPKSTVEEVPVTGERYVVNGEVYETDAEQEALAKAYMGQFSDAPAVPEMPQECAEKIAELEVLFTSFEQTHDLGALLAIDRMTVEEAKAHTARQAARADLSPIVALTNYVESQKKLGIVSEEAWQGVLARSNAIQRAIGTLQGDFLIHDRPQEQL